MKISIIIRAKNEARNLRKLIPQIKAQKSINQKDIEIIVVDNESSDKTQEVARNFGKVISISDKDFSYPKASNLGIKKSHGEIIIMLDAHAELIRNDWLKNIIKYFDDPEVAGVYSPELPASNASIWEKLFYIPAFYFRKITSPDVITSARPGVMAAVCCALRKSFWNKHHFNEKYGAGGEDLEWGIWALKNGYKIIRDTNCAVYHSHGLSLKNLIRQYKYWIYIRRPHPFDRGKLKYRI